MPKKANPQESDESRLKKKIAERPASGEDSQQADQFRSLRKRLKRAQRKRRAIAVKARNAAGRKGAATEKAG